MFDLWAVFYAGKYVIDFIDTFPDKPTDKDFAQAMKDFPVEDNPNLVGLFSQDADSGAYVEGRFINDMHETQFLRGKR